MSKVKRYKLNTEEYRSFINCRYAEWFTLTMSVRRTMNKEHQLMYALFLKYEPPNLEMAINVLEELIKGDRYRFSALPRRTQSMADFDKDADIAELKEGDLRKAIEILKQTCKNNNN